MTKGLDIGSRVLCDGEPGTIIDASPAESPDGYWRVKLDRPGAGGIVTVAEASPYLYPLDREHFLAAVLEAVAARKLSVDRAAALIALLPSLE